MGNGLLRDSADFVSLGYPNGSYSCLVRNQIPIQRIIAAYLTLVFLGIFSFALLGCVRILDLGMAIRESIYINSQEKEQDRENERKYQKQEEISRC